jgi:adenosylmethionine-8-amino-7-oxononanoate aminotransferase
MVRDGLLADARGVGALWAAELGEDTTELRAELLRRGVILRSVGTALALCPPLVISDEQVGALLDHLADALAERRR